MGEHDKPPRNTLLSQARCRLPSPSGSGQPMSRQELAEAINAYLWQTHEIKEGLDENDVGKLERGEHRWPGANRREAYRAVLGATSDAELGFYIVRNLSRVIPASRRRAMTASPPVEPGTRQPRAGGR